MLAFALDLILVSISCFGYLARPYVGHLKWLSKWLSVFDAVDEAYRAVWTWLQVKLGRLNQTDVRLMELGVAIQKSATKTTASSPEHDLLSQFNTRTNFEDHNTRHGAATGLILYFIQMHSENLIYLYAFISQQLESARLIRSAPSETGARVKSSTDGNANEGHNHLLDRYALLLMIVAYLESDTDDDTGGAGATPKTNKTSNEHIALTYTLLGFLKCYSQRISLLVSNDYEVAGGSSSSSSRENDDDDDKATATNAINLLANLRVKLVRVPTTTTTTTNADDTDEHEIVVMDPMAVAFNASGLETTDDANKDNDKFDRAAANLTRQLAVWPEIRQLFEAIHTKLAIDLQKASELCKVNASNESANLPHSQLVLSEISDLCAAHGAKRGHVDQHDELLMDCKGNGEAQSSAPSGQTADINNSEHGQLNAPTHATWSWARFKQNKLARNLLYLALFFFVRLVVVPNLESCQRDLMHEARGEFINLKRMLFPEMQVERLEDQDADGISILLRDEHHNNYGEYNSDDRSSSSDRSRPSMDTSFQEDEIINKRDGGDLSPTDQQQEAKNTGAKSSGQLSEEEQEAKAIEEVLMAILSHTMGRSAMGGVPMTPDKLQGFMDIMAQNANSGGSAGGVDDNDDDDEGELDDHTMARIMEQMKALMGNQDSGSAQELDGKHPGSDAGANINSASGGAANDDDESDLGSGDYSYDYEDLDQDDSGAQGSDASNYHQEQARTDL